MASTGYGSWISGDDWRAVVTASVDYSKDSTKATATVTVTGKLENVYASSSSGGSAWTGAVSNSSSGTNSTSFSGFGTNQTVTIKTNTFTVSRDSSDKTITARCAVTSPSSSIYGSQTSTATVSLAISARPTYTVSYNANGGSGAPSAQTKTYGVTLSLSSTKPTRTGYTFKNWNTKADGSGTSYVSGANYTANAAATLYAQWQIVTYTISYDANGGSGAPSSQTKTYGKTLTLSTTKPTRTGYTFGGSDGYWHATGGNTGWYAPGGTYTANASAKLYAAWTIKTYAVKYDANGGSGAPSAQTKTYDVTLKLSTTKPTRTGYTFKGWGTSSTTSTVSYAAGANYTANAATTLYAVWQINTYTVAYDANGGSGAPSAQTKTYGTDLTLRSASSNPTRTGYTFKNWNTNSGGTGTSYASGATYKANAAATLYAQWTINTYQVTFNANGGSGAPSAQTKTYGKTLTLSSTKPTRTGYTFQGWGTSSTDTSADYQPGGSYTANSGIALFAVWKANTYAVKYAANGGSSTPSQQTKTYGVTLVLASAISRATDTTTFTVKYDANGGSVGTASQTANRKTSHSFSKWKATDGTQYNAGANYTANEATTMTAQWTSTTTPATVTLPTPTRANYTFDGWYTAATGGTRVGGAGATYTATGDVTLHAQWVDAYTAPKIGGLVAKRRDSGDADDDAGTYCRCELRWEAGSKAVTSIEFTATGTVNGSTVTETATVTNPSTSPTAVTFGNGNLDKDVRFTVTATLTDGTTTLKRTTVLTPAFFTLDFLAGGRGIGVGQAVTQPGLWVAMASTFYEAVTMASATISGALSAASATISGLLTADRAKIAPGGSKGLLTTDSTGFEYPLISDNGNNLWIGAHKAAEQHHTGGTFISAGAGRDSIYVSVPNSDNTGATNYPALHTGYPVTTTTTISDVISAQTNVTVSSASFSQWGKFCMLSVTYTLSSEISVPANGNTANTALFTIAAGKRPVEYLDVMLDVNVGAWGHITTGGVVSLDGANSRGAAWTLDTTTARYLRCCYLLP